MHVINARNVGDAYVQGMAYIARVGQRADSRNGPVLVAPTPVCTVYAEPTERVLFDERRDANPFLHLAEAIWMLVGRCDGLFLTRFAAQFAEYVEPDGRQHGAYGHRWRHAFGFDQLDAVVERLKKNRADRQAVIQMWDARWEEGNDHDWYGSNDLNGNWRDRPCNTHIYLRIVGSDRFPRLDLTVCCRSNDIIWGAYGANAVHFSILQEYLAARIGVGVGMLYQISNNWHAYVDVYNAKFGNGIFYPPNDPYRFGGGDRVWPSQLVSDPETFDGEAAMVLEKAVDLQPFNTPKNRFLSNTLAPMLGCHYFFKEEGPERALSMVDLIDAQDWRRACKEWLIRRKVARDAKGK